MEKLHHGRKVGAHSNQETRPCDSSSPRPTVAPDSQPPPTERKRKNRTLSSLHQDQQLDSLDQSEHQAKRHKSSSKTHSSRSFTKTSWSNWDRTERDSLSRVWLTRKALRELNRRNALSCSRAIRLVDILTKPKQRPKDITHFARHGGPDLSDLRKVRYHIPLVSWLR